MMNFISRHVTAGYKNGRHNFCKLCLIASIAVGNPALASIDSANNWQFKVFLDGDEIGYHHFSMVKKDNNKEIYSSARFAVKFLFITAYSYEHDNVEHWSGQCLKSINAVTNDNGEQYSVSGNVDKDVFIVNTLQSRNSYPSCIKTFAYWDPEFLNETTLLNSQNGEMIAVESRFLGSETVTHKGESISARRYRLTADMLQIDLWYSDDDRWLALESVTENGRVVRYAIP